MITVVVTPVGGSGTPFGPTPCTTGGCVISFTANPGPNVLNFTLTDNASNVLSSFTTTQIVQPNIKTTLNLTANPVVHSVVLSLAAPSVTAGSSYDDLLTVNAEDEHNNIIVGSSNYVDANGSPVALVLTTANSQNGGHGTVTIKGSPRITAANQTAIYAHYDGNWLDHAAISATATSSAVITSGASTTLSTVPHATEYPAADYPYGIVSGPDGNLWFTENSGVGLASGSAGAGAIGKMTTSGAYSAPVTGLTDPTFIAVGPNRTLVFGLGYGGNAIHTITTSGSLVANISSGGLYADRVQTGPDGNLWYSRDSNTIIRVSPTGLNSMTYTLGSGMRGIGFGPDGSLWYASTGTTIGHITLNGASLGTATVAALGNYSDGVVAGPDGNMWITNYGSNQLDKVTPALGVTPIPLQAGAAPRDIVAGPDGKLWFTEYGKNTIGCIVPSSTTPTEFTTANGISATSGPVGITVGPDGNIWFTEFGKNAVAKFVW